MKTSRNFSDLRLTKNVSAFTLVEIIVAMTILALILTSVFQIYANIATMSKRLELARWLQNNVRTITESIARDVREGGIAFRCYESNGWVIEPGCDGGVTHNYATDGADELILRGNLTSCGTVSTCYIQYFLAKQTLTWPVKCTASDVSNWNEKPESACFLAKRFYGDIWNGVNGQIGEIVRLTDTTTRIDPLRFYISGWDASALVSNQYEWKVVVSFKVSLAPYKWINSELARQMVIPVQTTVSQKLYTAQQ